VESGGDANAPMPIPPSSRLASGPLADIHSIAAGVAGWPIRVTPPSAHRVMFSTVTPFLRAMTACAASCSSRLSIKAIAPSSAATV